MSPARADSSTQQFNTVTQAHDLVGHNESVLGQSLSKLKPGHKDVQSFSSSPLPGRQPLRSVFNRFAGRLLGAIFLLELAAGSAMLTSVVIQGGLRGLGIDSLRNRHKRVGPVAVFDLSIYSNVEVILTMIRQGEVDAIHAAPPCGTSTRARDIFVKNGPVPLRSEAFPEGLPGLHGLDALKVEAANQFYKHAAMILEEGVLFGCLCSAENPKRSYMWFTKWWRRIYAEFFHTLFQACMHGSERDKWSLWVSNWSELQDLIAVCDKMHTHAAWGRLPSGTWATAEEAAYPRLLCIRFLRSLIRALLARGVVAPPLQLDDDWANSMLRNQSMAVTSVKQPRGRKCPPLVREFKIVTTIIVAADEVLPVAEGRPLAVEYQNFPIGSKLLRQSKRGVDGSKELVFGVPWSPKEFSHEASKAKHPFQMQAPLPDALLKVVFDLVTKGPEFVSKTRLSKLTYWRKVRKDLESKEAELHSTLHTDVKRVLCGKKLLLFKQMLDESGYVDTALFSDIVSGFKVTGFAKTSHAFVPEVRLPSMTEEDLLTSARWTRHSILGSTGPSGDEALDNEVWAETQEEVSKGWLVPVLESELDSRFGKGAWSPARRFGLRQGDAMRAIDDYSMPLTNFAFGSTERLDLMGVDELSALIRFIARLLSRPWNDVSLTLRDGSKLEGRRHEHWTKVRSKLALFGRSLDLTIAYRQLASHPDSARWCIIATYCPLSRSAVLFYQPVLAFGASSAVLGFNRVSRALWWLGVTQFHLTWLNYFDDFPCLEVPELTASSVAVSEGLFELLGWMISKKETKYQQYKQTFVSLGVQYDLGKLFTDEILEVSNKPGRVEGITLFVAGVLVKGRFSSLELDSLRGRLQFAEAQTFARLARFGLAPIHALKKGSAKSTVFVTDEIKEGLQFICAALAVAKPRRIPLHFPSQNIITFSDGACEGESFSHVTSGASVIEPGPAGNWWFHFEVPEELAHSWRVSGSKSQVIAEAEMFPVLVCRAMFAVRGVTVLAVHYVDNDGVADGLIRGMSPIVSLRDMLYEYALQESDRNIVSWIARVASASNPGDAPSRMSVILDDGLDRGLDRSTEAKEVARALGQLLVKRRVSVLPDSV